MRRPRREFMKLVALMVTAELLPAGLVRAEEWNKAGFSAKKLDELYRVLGVDAPQQSDQIVLNGPEIAENGAVVPLELESKLPNTEMLAVLIEKNPSPLAAIFTLATGTVPDIQTRVKMNETCDVYLLARVDGKFYYAVKEIKVTLGGCGG
jgi:sulfur-oxidizing protein SoxY